MNSNILTQLLKFLEEDPNDPFIIYGIAMEYSKSDFEKGMEYFNRLLNHHPDYVPTYYHAGKLLEKLGKADEAIAVYKKGMDISRGVGNHHAHTELQSALNQLLDNEE